MSSEMWCIASGTGEPYIVCRNRRDAISTAVGLWVPGGQTISKNRRDSIWRAIKRHGSYAAKCVVYVTPQA